MSTQFPRPPLPVQEQPIESAEEINDEEWDVTFRTNIHAMVYLTKAAIIDTTSVNADTPSPQLRA